MGDPLQEDQILNRRTFFTAAGFSAILAGVCSATTPAFALDPRTAAALRRLDPELRLEQICDIEAMERIRKDSAQFQPDRAKSNVISPPRHLGDTLEATGAAFRSKQNWYKFSFVCISTADHLKVTSFKYTIGRMIPEREYEYYSLWK